MLRVWRLRRRKQHRQKLRSVWRLNPLPLAATPEAGSAYPNPAAEMLIQGSPAITETAMLSESEVTAATSIAAAPPVANDQTLSQTAAEPVSQPQPTFWNTWRLSELILIVLAIIAAMAAIRLRRTGN